MAIFVAILVWAAVAIVNMVSPPVIEWGKLSTDQEISAIIVREETIVYSAENGKFENVGG